MPWVLSRIFFLIASIIQMAYVSVEAPQDTPRPTAMVKFECIVCSQTYDDKDVRSPLYRVVLPCRLLVFSIACEDPSFAK